MRTDLQFAEAHVPGAVLVTHLRSGFGTKLAWVAEPAQEIVFIGRDDADGRRAARLAAAVGVRGIAGYLAGGMTAWREERRPVARMERLAAEDLARRWRPSRACRCSTCASDASGTRATSPARSTPPTTPSTGCPTASTRGRPSRSMCASGQRSGLGASLLVRAGAADVIHVMDGGVGTCAAAGVALVAD